MNSSVTWERATSVISSLCLEIRPSSRSNGPSNTSRCTSNPAGLVPCAAASPGSAVTAPVTPLSAASCQVPQPPGQQARLTLGIEIGEQYGDGLADQPATIHSNPIRAQREPGSFQGEQLSRGQVHGDLLRVRFPAAGLAARSRGRP